MFIDYTATRNLVGSGLAELETKIEPKRRKLKVESTESVGMSGVNREVQMDRYDVEWMVKTVHVPIATEARWLEFAESVLAGETFTIDLDGTKAVPVDPITASMVKGTFDRVRVGPGHFKYSFSIVER